jgi:hypothetical protein
MPIRTWFLTALLSLLVTGCNTDDLPMDDDDDLVGDDDDDTGDDDTAGDDDDTAGDDDTGTGDDDTEDPGDDDTGGAGFGTSDCDCQSSVASWQGVAPPALLAALLALLSLRRRTP